MNDISIVISALMGIAFGSFVIKLMLRIRSNVIIGKLYRQALRTELSTLRFDRMLAALGIDREGYLHTQNTRDVHQHLQHCRDCSNTSQCDEKLYESDTVDVGEIDYCSNAGFLKDITAQQASSIHFK